MSSNIENYLGFPTGLTGANLARRAVAQARDPGRKFSLLKKPPVYVLMIHIALSELNNGTEINCHTLVIATGVSYRRLDVPGIERLTGVVFIMVLL